MIVPTPASIAGDVPRQVHAPQRRLVDARVALVERVPALG